MHATLQGHGLRQEVDKWAERALTLAKAKHREVNKGKAPTDFDLQVLGGLKHRITAAWSKQSESGQAAVIITGLCTEFYYQCLAFGRLAQCMRRVRLYRQVVPTQASLT